MKLSKSVLSTIVSPWIGLFLSILRGKKKQVSFCFAIISTLFIPLETNDKFYYKTIYNEFLSNGYDDLIYFLTFKLDFIFYPLLFLTSKLNIPFELFNFIVSFTTLYLIFSFLEQNVPSKQDKRVFILVLLSLSFADFFSGLRFYLALSILLYSISFSNNFKQISFGLVSLLFHPSLILHFTSFYLFNNKANKELILKIIFITSLIVGFTGLELIIDTILEVLPENKLIEDKVNGYFFEQTKTLREFRDGNINFFLFFYYRYLIFIFFSVHAFYLLLKKRFSKIDVFSILSIIIMSLMITVPEVLLRFSLFHIPLFIAFILNRKQFLYTSLFTVYCMIYFILQVLINFNQIFGKLGINALTFNLIYE